MEDLGFLALVFEFVILFACATLCTSAVVLPTIAPPSQDHPSLRRSVSDVAAAAAAAATGEVCPSPSPETIQVIHVAARVATAATAAALGRGPLGLSGASQCQYTSRHAAAANNHGVGRHEEAGDGRGATGGGGGGTARASGGARRGRKPRTPIPLGDKIALIDIKDAGHTWSETLSMFRLNISVPAARAIYKKREEYKRRAAASEDLSATRLRRSYFESVSQGLRDWYRTLQRVGGRHLPVSGGL